VDNPAALAESLNWMGNWHANAEDSASAVEYHQQALEIVEELGDRRDLANTLDLLGLAYLLGGDLTASVRTYDRTIALCRKLDDRLRLVTGLIARAVSVSLQVMLASVPASSPPDALRDLEAAIRIARETDSASDETWAHWALGLLHTVQGRLGHAMQALQEGLRIAVAVGHREYEWANRWALGVLYVELFSPKEAQQQLGVALNLAKESRSQVHIHYTTGVLAWTHFLQGDIMGAQTCLETVLSADTPMDTMGNRYCWARWAELALAQGDAPRTLDITDRLIASAPGMSPGSVITHLWWLKGKALTALGHTEEAHPLLQAAAQNAYATGERFLLWRTHVGLGRLHLALGRQSVAEEEFSTARELIEELGETLPDGELRDNFLRRAYIRLSPSP
jgi:tetratricopeptide (TPR) repeat protein